MVPQSLPRGSPVARAGPAAGRAAARIGGHPAELRTVTTPPSAPTGLTYRDAGVDIDAGNEVVERIKPLVRRSFRPEVMGGLGGFGALFDLSGKYREPVLVSGTDGVGTKLKLAQQLGRHDTIGIDLVGMCVNDVLVRAPNRCSSWTTSPPASSTWTPRSRWWAASPGVASSPAAR